MMEWKSIDTLPNHSIYNQGNRSREDISEQLNHDEILKTDKLNGMFCSYTIVIDNGEIVSELLSSDILNQGNDAFDDELCWNAVRNSGVRDSMYALYNISSDVTGNKTQTITVIGLVAQAINDFSKNAENSLEILVFDVESGGERLGYDDVNGELRQHWIPAIYKKIFA